MTVQSNGPIAPGGWWVVSASSNFPLFGPLHAGLYNKLSIKGEVKHDAVSQIHLIWTLHVGLLLKGGGGVVSMCHSFLICGLDYFFVWRS